jgi:YcxB-like protein
MSSDEAAVSFIVDYEMTVDDLREQDIVGRLAAWRAKPLWSRWVYPVLLLVFVAATVFITPALSGCFIPMRGVWVVQQSCDPTMTPSGLLQTNGGLFAADGAFFMLTVFELGRAWERPGRWRYRRAMKRYGLSQHYRCEVAADGVTVARPDGAISYVPWPVFTAVRETRERFLLCGREYGWGWVLPKRALADPASVQQLSEFLRASVGREPPPA